MQWAAAAGFWPGAVSGVPGGPGDRAVLRGAQRPRPGRVLPRRRILRRRHPQGRIV